MAACETQAQKDMDRQRGRETDTRTYTCCVLTTCQELTKCFTCNN